MIRGRKASKPKIALLLIILSMLFVPAFYAAADETEYEEAIISDSDEWDFYDDLSDDMDEITVSGEDEETETEGLFVDLDELPDEYDETVKESENTDLSSIEMNPETSQETVISDGTDGVPDNIISSKENTYEPMWGTGTSEKLLLSAASGATIDTSSFFGSQLSGPAYTLYSHRVKRYAEKRETSSFEDTNLGDSESGYLFSYTGKYKIENGYLNYDLTNEEDAEAYTECVDNLKYAMQATQDAFEMDHPEVFWHRTGRTWTFRWNFDKSSMDKESKTCTFYVSSVTYSPVETYSGAIDSMNAFDSAVQETKAALEQAAAGSDSDEEWAVKYARQASLYLAENVVYGSEYSSQAQLAEENEKSTGIQEVNDVFSIYSPAGAFLGNAGTGNALICEGYAKAFKVLCDVEGIPCICVCGVAGGIGHMWNAVSTEDGTWYFTDPTWCDNGGTINPKYFMVTKNQPGRTMSGKRTTSQYSPAFIYPALSEECYRTCHQYQATSSTDATCTHDGEQTRVCEWCSAQEVITLQPALGHNYETDIKAATCENAGSVTQTCSRCGDTITDTIPATGHDYKVTENKSATCNENGYKKELCTNCGVVEKTILPKTGHSYKTTSTVAATCEKAGSVTQTCSRCGDTITEAIPATGHNYKITATKRATCTKDGYEKKTCTNCGIILTSVLPKTGHLYKVTAKKSATCTKSGIITYTCKRCSAKTSKTIQPTGHLYNQKQTIKPTCTKEGYTRHTCTRCGTYYDDKTTPPNGHNYKKTNIIPATEKKGAVETDTCTKCGYKFTKTISNPLSEAQIIKQSGLKKAVTLKKLKSSSKKIKIKWSYAKKYKKKATSYEIQVSSNKQFKGCQTIIAGKKKASTKTGTFSRGTYYVRIRAVNENGHSAWSKTKKIKLK